MRTLKTLFYILLFNTGLLSTSFLLNISEEPRSFGVSGTILFEGQSSRGTRVVLTVGDEEPDFSHAAKDSSYIEEYLSGNGEFYRAISHTSGEHLSIWIQRDGYPLVQLDRVLDYSRTSINLGQVIIPEKLQDTQQTPVHFYNAAPCAMGRNVVSALPRDIKVLKKFRSARCQTDGIIHFGAEVEFAEENATVTLDNPQAVDVKELSRMPLSF